LLDLVFLLMLFVKSHVFIYKLTAIWV